MLHDIRDKCLHDLESSVDKNRACVVLQTAHDLHLDDLQANVLNFILKSGESCLESKGFLSLSPECLRLVIESDDLMCKEEIIYQKIIEWSTHRCQDQNLPVNDENIRKVLGELLYLVRFPIMEQTYFTENVSKIKLLTVDELLKVYQSFDDDEVDMFSTKRRSIEHLIFSRCDDKTNNLSSREMSEVNDCLDFTTHGGLSMLGINLFGSSSYSGKHDINLTILKSSEVLRSINTCLYSTMGQEIYPVMFDKPLRVKGNTRYRIQLNMKGPRAFTGTYHSDSVRVKKLTVTFSNPVVPSKRFTVGNMEQIAGLIMQPIYIRNKLVSNFYFLSFNFILVRSRVMVFNATFNNISVISWRSALLVEEAGVPGENHRPVTCD